MTIIDNMDEKKNNALKFYLHEYCERCKGNSCEFVNRNCRDACFSYRVVGAAFNKGFSESIRLLRNNLTDFINNANFYLPEEKERLQ